MRDTSPRATRYAFAVAVILTMLAVRSLMAPLWETTAPFALFMLAAVVSAWFAGTGPAILTGAAGLAVRLYFDNSGPSDGPLPVTWEEAVRLSLFAGFVGGTAVVLSRMKADRRELERRMRGAQEELERRRELEATLREARRAAEEANRMKDEFLAMVSHELRTPLNAILGWASLLRSGSLSQPRTAHAIDVIERNARVQAQLIDDLLDVARSLTGELHLDQREVDLGRAAAAAVARMQPHADAKGVALRVEQPGSPVPVWGDLERLELVIAKLLGNGIKFTPAGGEVSLRLAVDGSRAVLVVQDTGAGIGPEFLPRVFDQFTQAEAGATRRYGGLGLGLTVVRQLIELHRGRVEAHSDGDGRGARFTILLPLWQGPGDPDDAPPGGGVTDATPPVLHASWREI